MFVDKNSKKPIENIIEIDDEIYPVLKVLWDKGYETKFSCAGHNELLFIQDEYKNKFELIYQLRKQIIQINICFDKNYCFEACPDNFDFYDACVFDSLSSSSTEVLLTCIISAFKDKKRLTLKSVDEIDEELNVARNNLLNWALSLPDLKKDNLERMRKNKIWEK